MGGNPNGFTLIELLVVVAIIGVLAAGVIAFNGFMTKISTKSQHKTVVNYIKRISKMFLGEENLNYKKMDFLGNDGALSVSCSANADMHSSLDDHFEVEGFANPFWIRKSC